MSPRKSRQIPEGNLSAIADPEEVIPNPPPEDLEPPGPQGPGLVGQLLLGAFRSAGPWTPREAVTAGGERRDEVAVRCGVTGLVGGPSVNPLITVFSGIDTVSPAHHRNRVASCREAERINEQSESRRRLTAAWIVEVVSRPGR